MSYARRMNESLRVNAFHPSIATFTSMREVYSYIVQIEGPSVVTDFDYVFFYRKWDGWSKDLTFELRMPS